jgi:Rps23 Pro-64 3,4-dihydroxylase Tpa1-like proline 4-hydroxylase
VPLGGIVVAPEPTARQVLTDLARGPVRSQDVRAMRPGHLLCLHSDDLSRRRVAFVLYLSPGCSPEHGGALRVVHPATRVACFDATANSLVVLDVQAGTGHQVTLVGPAAGARTGDRLSGWLEATGASEARL